MGPCEMGEELRSTFSRRKWHGGLERTLPEGRCSVECFGQHFAEVTLDTVEEDCFQRRYREEIGPRYCRLRPDSKGEPTVPPHIEENQRGSACRQLWVGQSKVDRTLFVMDRKIERRGRRRFPAIISAPRRQPRARSSAPLSR